MFFCYGRWQEGVFKRQIVGIFLRSRAPYVHFKVFAFQQLTVALCGTTCLGVLGKEGLFVQKRRARTVCSGSTLMGRRVDAW